MNGRFIYALSETARDRLLKLGFRQLSEDEERHTYVFVNDRAVFSELDGDYVMSDTLTL